MPAPAVALVAGSMTMKLPVVRLASYGSNSSGRAAVTVTSPISFIVSRLSSSAVTVRAACFSR